MTDEAKAHAPLSDIASALRRSLGLPADFTPVQLTPEQREAQDHERTQRAIQEQRMAYFRAVCPPEFQKKIDPALIESPAAWAEADKWDGKFPGLWLWSNDTGKLKTRMLWRKFGQFHVKQGRSVMRTTGVALAEEYHDAYNHSRTSQFYARFKGFYCVMLDDLDKMALPDPELPYGQQEQGMRNGRMLREIFDRFYESNQSVLVTANEPISFFAQRIGPSAERRMKEVCREIQFT